MNNMELKENAVLIFKNDRKNGETHPDYKGEIDVNGQRFDIALWVKEGTKGKFYSGKISEPWKKPEAEPAKEQPQADGPTNTDDLPF
jgi:hypothetical protein